MVVQRRCGLDLFRQAYVVQVIGRPGVFGVALLPYIQCCVCPSTVGRWFGFVVLFGSSPPLFAQQDRIVEKEGGRYTKIKNHPVDWAHRIGRVKQAIEQKRRWGKIKPRPTDRKKPDTNKPNRADGGETDSMGLIDIQAFSVDQVGFQTGSKTKIASAAKI